MVSERTEQKKTVIVIKLNNMNKFQMYVKFKALTVITAVIFFFKLNA